MKLQHGRLVLIDKNHIHCVFYVYWEFSNDYLSLLYRENIQSDTFLIQPARFTTRLYTASLMLFTIQTVCYIKLSTISVNKRDNKLMLCVDGIYIYSIFWWVWKLALDLFYWKVQIIIENLLNGKKIDDCPKPFLLKSVNNQIKVIIMEKCEWSTKTHSM